MATEAQRRANKKYFADNYSQVKLSMPNDEADALRQYCADHGLTVAGFIRSLIRDAIAVKEKHLTPDGARGGMVESDGAGVSSSNIREQ